MQCSFVISHLLTRAHCLMQAHELARDILMLMTNDMIKCVLDKSVCIQECSCETCSFLPHAEVKAGGTEEMDEE